MAQTQKTKKSAARKKSPDKTLLEEVQAQTQLMDESAPPRPATPDEIVAMMDEAAQTRAKQHDDTTQNMEEPGEDGGAWHVASFWLLWAGIFIAIAAVIYVVIASSSTAGLSVAVAGGVALLIALFVGGAAMMMFSPMLLAGVMLRRATGRQGASAAGLAGAEILGALGLAERVLDSDPDARLVTRRDGVVTYASRAYFDLAKDAGIIDRKSVV